MPDPSEERVVTRAALQSGVQLKAGHAVRLVLDGPAPDVIHVQLHNEHSGEPMRGVHYHLVLHDGSVREGVTDGEGFVFEEQVPKGSYKLSVGRELKGFDAGAGQLHVPVEPHPRHGVALRPLLVARHVRVLRVGATPQRGMENDAVALRAQVMGGEGETVTFRIHRGKEQKPLATVEGKVADGVATARWTIPAVQGAMGGRGRAYDEFEVEAECHGSVSRSPAGGELRGYRRTR